MNQPKTPPWLENAAKPCDPVIFRRAVDAWESCGRDAELGHRAGTTVRYLRSAGVPYPQAYLIRIMEMGEIFEATKEGGLLAFFVKPGAEDGSLLVSEALLDAVATTPLRHAHPRGPMFDLEAIRHSAQAAFDADESANELGVG